MCAGHPTGTELSCILVEHGARICDNTIDGTRPLDLLPVSTVSSVQDNHFVTDVFEQCLGKQYLTLRVMQ